MNRLSRAALVTLVFTAGSMAADEKTEWLKVVSKDDKCEVEFPGKPETAPGRWKLTTENGKAVLFLLVSKLKEPVDLDKADRVNGILNNGRDAAVKQLKGKVLSDKELKVNAKYPARDIDIDAPGMGIYRTRLVLTPTKLYQVTAFGPKAYVDAEVAKKFMGSFKLTD